MAQSLTQKVSNTFIKGLITEAGELTFPPDASVDELNCALFRDGSRRRREGLVYEGGNVLSTFTIAEDEVVTTGIWKNVAGIAQKEYLVVQVGSKLYFYRKTSSPLSAGEIIDPGTGNGRFIDLTSHEFTGGLSSAEFKCQFSSLNGVLIVSSPAINTIYIEENSSDDILSTEIEFRVRDFEFQSDRQLLFDPVDSSTVTAERKYDTANSGWVGTKGSAALSSYISAEGEYPALNLPWYSGKDSNGNFSVSEWNQIYSGTTLTSNGHFILNFFAKNRDAVSGISGVGREVENSRFKTVESFAGRMFYAGLDSQKNSGVILFSRIIEQTTSGVAFDNSGLGDCFQSNDPTAEDISDLLDTDGGVIRIPDAIGIQRLHSFQNSLFVMAENGIWRIKGIDDVFRATEYSVTKISEVGLRNPSSFVSADGIPFWWSDSGIYTLSPDSAGFNFSDNNLTLSTIQTFYDNIDAEAKVKTTGVYDQVNKRIFWAYPDNAQINVNKLNNFLILDLPLQAFYPWKVSDQESSDPTFVSKYVVGTAFYGEYGAGEQIIDVRTKDGDDVIQGSDDVIITQDVSISTGEPQIVTLVRDNTSGQLTMATFSGSLFLDWEDTNYTSFAEAGFDFMGDLMTEKTAPYLQVYMRRTETGFVGDEITGYFPIRDSSLLVSAFWDFKNTASSATQQAYRRKLLPVIDSSAETSNFPDTVIDTRLKIRGKGKSMRLRFESEAAKDFVLLGYGIIHAKNQRF